MLENIRLYGQVIQTHDPVGGDYYSMTLEELAQLDRDNLKRPHRPQPRRNGS
jgi:hypothetical protein